MGRRSGSFRGWGGGLGQYAAVYSISELGTPVVRARAVDFPTRFSDHCPTSFLLLSLSPSRPSYSLSTSGGGRRSGHSSSRVRAGDTQDRHRSGEPTYPSHTVPFLGCGPVSRGPPDPVGEGGKSAGCSAKAPQQAQSGLHD